VDHAGLADGLEALHPQCFNWAMACCQRERAEAEDVLHDVYVTVLEGKARFDERSSMKTWLFGVIRRTARARQRRDRLRELLGIRHGRRIDISPEVASPADDAVAEDRRTRTRRALAKLARRQREVLELVFYHHLTIEEAAKIMAVSLGSARVHYQRGKTRMAALLVEVAP